MSGPYRCVVAEPPWNYRDHLGDGPRGASSHYGCISVADICALPVREWTDPKGAHLFVWVTNAFMVEGHEVCRAWGFEPRTILTWVKDRIGLGHYFRNTPEHVIFAVRGNLRSLRRDMPSHFIGKRRAHSEKPEGLLWIAEQMSPGPRLELFARRRRDGWDVWGDEAPEAAQRVLELPA